MEVVQVNVRNLHFVEVLAQDILGQRLMQVEYGNAWRHFSRWLQHFVIGQHQMLELHKLALLMLDP